nr:hypothetical protein [Tanacetum cinerariifolium]
MATVLTSMDAATLFAGGIDVPTGSYSVPTAGPPAVDIHTSSDAVPTASLIVATATIVTPYSRRNGKEVMVESDTPKKQRLQEQIDAQVARELEEQQEREDKRMTEQIARDAEVVRIHAEEKLQGWKVKDFKGMKFEEIEAKFAAQKTSEEVLDKEKSTEEILVEKVKEMMQLIPIEEVYVQALQVKHPIIDWKDRATIAKSSTLPYDTAPRVTSPATVEGRGIDVPTGSYSIPTAGPPAVDIHTGSDVVPTAKLQGMIDSLDRTNETIAKYLNEEAAGIDKGLKLQRRKKQLVTTAK